MRTVTRAVPPVTAGEIIASIISHMHAMCRRIDHLWRRTRWVWSDECARCRRGRMVSDGRDAHLSWTRCTSCRAQVGVRRAS